MKSIILKKVQSVGVELGAIDEVKKLSKRADGFADDGRSFLQKGFKSYSEAANNLGRAKDIAENSIEIAKELGADSLVKELQSAVGDINSKYNEYTKTAAKLKAID